jgi:hypothetical protein
MNNIKLIAFLTGSIFFSSCDSLQHVQNGAKKFGVDTEKMTDTVLENTGLATDSASSKSGLSNSDIIKGLKEALAVGTRNAVSVLNAKDGYLKNPAVKLLFPADAQRAADKLREIGMGSLVDKFEVSLNRAAEDAAIEGQKIFVNAILQMSFADAKGILQGGNGAATKYFKDKTTSQLYASFSPKIKTSLDKGNVTKYWSDITSTYNKIPFVEKVNTDLTAYATNKAMDGLFLKVEEEENKIRLNPAARITDILKKVFGSL